MGSLWKNGVIDALCLKLCMYSNYFISEPLLHFWLEVNWIASDAGILVIRE